MRTVIRFEVTGATAAQLTDKATEVYRRLVEDHTAEIPYSATFDITPAETVESGDGTRIATSWTGEVTISLASADERGR